MDESTNAAGFRYKFYSASNIADGHRDPPATSEANRSGGPVSKSVNWPAFATRVSRALLGEPSSRSRTELRFGQRGSPSVKLDSGTWFDHETKEGGGMAALVARERRCSTGEALNRLRKGGFDCPALEYENAAEWFRRRHEEYKGLRAHFGHSETKLDVIMFPDAEGMAWSAHCGPTETLVIMNAIMFPHAEGWDFREPAVKAIVEGFEREITEGSTTLYLLHDGEAEARKVDSWDRYIAYRALKRFVEVASERSEFVDRDGEWRDLLRRAEAILDKRAVERPAGRRDPRLNCGLDFVIVSLIHEWHQLRRVQPHACYDLHVTSGSPRASLAAAMAEAWDIPEHRIARAWRDAHPLLRPDRKGRTRRCARCGKPAGEGARRDGEEGDLLCRACCPS